MIWELSLFSFCVLAGSSCSAFGPGLSKLQGTFHTSELAVLGINEEQAAGAFMSGMPQVRR